MHEYLRPSCVLAALAVALAGFTLAKWTYNVFFHPLSSYPGPLLSRASRLPYCYELLSGTRPFRMLDLHKRYGTVVRVAPDELAFADAAAWKDIMGHRTGSAATGNSTGEEMRKWELFYRPVGTGWQASDIVFSDHVEHGQLRRQLAHGFSDRSMRDQQPLIAAYIDLLISRLAERGRGGAVAVNMADWYNFTTFDVIGELAFGESFGCLTNSDYHPWVRAIFELGRVGTFFQAAAHYPLLQRAILACVPASAMRHRQQHQEFVHAKLRRRMDMPPDRPDLMEGLLRKRAEWDMSIDKLEANGSLLIIGGSETTATLLSGVTYYLLTNLPALRRLTAEVRGSFAEEAEIDLVSVSRLSYMLACLDEALRMYPPVPIGLPRVVPPGGATIAGHFVPAKTIVAVHQWATYHNDAHFRDPFEYRPERFLGDPRYASDNRDALQPFHVGPRNCVGKNLAYAEMRLILARVIFNFDMRIADESRRWSDQKVWNLWKKGPLMVYLTPAGKLASQ